MNDARECVGPPPTKSLRRQKTCNHLSRQRMASRLYYIWDRDLHHAAPTWRTAEKKSAAAGINRVAAPASVPGGGSSTRMLCHAIVALGVLLVRGPGGPVRIGGEWSDLVAHRQRVVCFPERHGGDTLSYRGTDRPSIGECRTAGVTALHTRFGVLFRGFHHA
jgi:hypothetical protein